MKRTNTLLLFAILSPGWGSTITITDPFDVPGASDVIGSKLRYDAQNVQVTTGQGTLTFDIFTNFDNSHLYSFLDTGARIDIGDVFFTIDGAYSYGIPLSYHNGPAGGPWGARLLGGHVYQITDPSALLTARQALHDPRYLGYRPDSIVWMIDTGGVRDVTVGTPSVQVLPLSGADGANGPRYDIRVNTSLPAGLFASRSETYGLHWAVTTGANDLVEGALPVGAEVPEPESIYFVIGAALIGISRLLLRRR